MRVSNSISSDHIESFVDKMMQNKSINFSMIPDYIEKKLYINVFSIVLNILDLLLDSITIEIMGHKITIDIEGNKDFLETAKNLRSISEIDLEAQNSNSDDIGSSELQRQLIDDYNKLHPVKSDGGFSSSSAGDNSGEVPLPPRNRYG